MGEVSTIKVYGVNRSPYISVVILAYERKEYIKRAVRSVIEQDLNDKSIEILVVKNFIDQALDLELKNLGCKIINSSTKELGGKIIEGFSNSNGQIVSLLEDDDFFYPGKLKAIEAEFKENPELVFFQHPTDVWDMEGKRLISSGSRKKPVICQAPVTIKTFRKYFSPPSRLGIYNNSSYCIRKDKFQNDLGPFKEMIRGCDDYLFLSTLSLDGYIKLGSQSLGARTLNLTNSSEDKEIKKFIDNSARSEAMNLKTYGVYLQHFKNDPQRRMSNYLLMRSLLRFAIFKSYEVKLKDIINSLKLSLFFNDPYLTVLLIWAILSKINRRKVQIRFYKKESVR